MRTTRLKSWLLALCVSTIVAVPAVSPAQVSVGVAVSFGPPALPIYEQPPIPAVGYIWTPGYWGYDGSVGYFWVPGTWVLAPEPGLLWTPGYWGWNGGSYYWHEGYWGAHVGFYGGVDYGFGYVGSGYQGGYWNGRTFYYNRSVNNISGTTNITNVYNKTVIVNNTTVTHVSYSGGPGGVSATPTAAEESAAREGHTPPTPMQEQHVRTASTNRAQFASVNHGSPAVVATPKPGAFSGKGVVTTSRVTTPYHAVSNNAPAKATAPTRAGGHAASTTPARSQPSPAERTGVPAPVKTETAPRTSTTSTKTAPPAHPTETKPAAPRPTAPSHAAEPAHTTAPAHVVAPTHETQLKPAAPSKPAGETKASTAPVKPKSPPPEEKPKSEP